MNRRDFIGSMLAAPAIVRAEILMPVTKIWTPPTDLMPLIWPNGGPVTLYQNLVWHIDEFGEWGVATAIGPPIFGRPE